MILIVDDDRSILASLALLLKQAGYRSQTATDPAEAWKRLSQENYSLLLLDLNFSRQTSGEEGLTLLRRIKERHPALPVILITAWGSIPLAVRGIQAGAVDFIVKPWSTPQILQAVKTGLALADAAPIAATATVPGREGWDVLGDFRGLIGRDPALLRVMAIVVRVARTDASVLITGESGVGKELVAEAIHRNSERRNRSFLKVNLGGISTTLFESEMFGHVRGAFTDAHQDRPGRFEAANGGTIFLDEIGDLEPGSQVKLLRVLQDRTYEVLGSSRPRTVDVRVLSATNRNLAELVEKGLFREDLLYRLNLISLHIPALRERPGDIPLLARYFLDGIAKTYRRNSLSIRPEAMAWLQAQTWPGNVRQLKQIIERAVLIGGEEQLDTAVFQKMVRWESSEAARRDPLPEVGSMTMEEMERAMIGKALQHHAGNISRAAESLGMTRTSLYRRMEKYGIRT